MFAWLQLRRPGLAILAVASLLAMTLTKVEGLVWASVLLLGWGGTYGAITTGGNRLRKEGYPVSTAHLRYLNPLPSDLEDVIGRFKKVLIPELNLGQLRFLIRSNYCVDAIGLNKVQGRPFFVAEIVEAIKNQLA